MEPEQNQSKTAASLNWKIVLPTVLVIAIVLAGALYFLMGAKNTAVAPTNNSNTAQTNSSTTEANGSVDGITNQEIQNATSEQSVYNDEGSDKSLVTNDSSDMSSFDQAYNENGF